MRQRARVLLAVAAGFAGCSGGDRAPSEEGQAAAPQAETRALHPDAPPGIDWFAGGVDAAFARAAAENRPVFLYWGAVWCPYCADLKAHVFSRRDFQERLHPFVAVYLDGDDPGAQKWADEFDVAGYPTVLALAPDRTELARIAGGMDVALYPEMLDLVLGDVRPLEALLASVRQGSGELSREECRRLAYNGWGLDEPAAGAADLAATLARAAARCPVLARVERARLTAIALSYAVEAEAESIEHGVAPSPVLRKLLDDVQEIVADRGLAVTAADALQYLGTPFFAAARRLTAPGEASRLLDNWSGAMQIAAHDSRYTEGDRLLAMRSRINAVRGLGAGGPLPPELVAEAHALLDAALARALGTPARAGAVNAAVNLLIALDEPERARALSLEAMTSSRTPYYHMADVAMLDEQLGRFDDALTWLERAYRESTDTATRFQWGASYVRGLIRMRPDDEAAISAAAIEVLGELEGPDRIYRRTRGRLATLDAALREWNAGGAHDDAIAAIRGRSEDICNGIPVEEAPALASCREFLAWSGG